uniref:Uncharacterized protein n=1 Tax=Rhizophora mucronata TaxID=61149 RepID=A0A2P2L044_RHIMU
MDLQPRHNSQYTTQHVKGNKVTGENNKAAEIPSPAPPPAANLKDQKQKNAMVQQKQFTSFWIEWSCSASNMNVIWGAAAEYWLVR